MILTIMPITEPLVRVFANGPKDRVSVPSRVIPNTQIVVLDASLLNTQHCKVRSKGKGSNPNKGVAPHLHIGVVAIEERPFRSPSTIVD